MKQPLAGGALAATAAALAWLAGCGGDGDGSDTIQANAIPNTEVPPDLG